MKKKFVTNLEKYKIINELLSNTEGLAKGASSPYCEFYRKPYGKGYFNICVTTKCEGAIIGTYYIDYIPNMYVRDPYTEWNIWSGMITIYDDPHRIVKAMFRSIEHFVTDLESGEYDEFIYEDDYENVLNGKEAK